MPYVVKEVTGRVQLEETLNSALVLGPLDNTLPVGGRTLIFAVPARTVTFSGAVGSSLTLNAIAAEIKAAHADFNSFVIHARSYPAGQQVSSAAMVQRVFVIQDDAGFTIDKDGTANPYLKLQTDADLVVPAAITATKIAALQNTAPGQYLLVIAP